MASVEPASRVLVAEDVAERARRRTGRAIFVDVQGAGATVGGGAAVGFELPLAPAAAVPGGSP